MRSDLLHVITPSFNIRRFKSHGINMRRFAQHMLESGVRLHIIESAFGDIPFALDDIEGVDHIGVYGQTPVWNKERLINIAISRLPRDWKYVAWIDGDIEFMNPDWAEETVYALQHYGFVQPWEHCYDLGPKGEHIDLHHSFGRQWIKAPDTIDKMGKGYTFAHPGYAWAATRQALEGVGGLLDTAALGAADHHMALALVGKAHLSVPGKISEGYKAPIMNWMRRAEQHIAGGLGYIGGTISHKFHGAKKDRAYVSRWDILVKHAFDPATDLKVNTAGLYELTGNKPALKRDMMAYFADRNEDATVL
jgi:hypothetical protein